VSLPHGFGHGRGGIGQTVAAAHPGASANDVTDDRLVDLLTGNAALNGVPVRVEAVARSGVVALPANASSIEGELAATNEVHSS
jgi:hypothetical protein